jgi:imidazolonepropionase-like amidohydrolase
MKPHSLFGRLWSPLPRRLAAGLSLAALAAPLALASGDVPPPPQREPLLITGATLHPMSGPALPNGQLLIEHGRITAVAPAGQALSLPQGTQRLDLTGRHLYPGFISANSALGLVEVESVRATIDASEVGPINPNARSLVAVNADSDLIPVARANGVLAALAVPSNRLEGLFTGTSALIQMEGWNWEDMAVEPAVAVHLFLPSQRLSRGGDSPAAQEAQKKLREAMQEKHLAIERALESAQAYGQARSADPQGTPRDLRWEALQPVLAGRMPLMVHAQELAQIRHALNLAERFGFKLVIVGGADSWRVADVLAQRQVSVLIADVQALPLRRDDEHDSAYRLASRLHQAGVRFAIARSGDLFAAANERNLPHEAATAVAFGLPRDEALKAITLYPAQILGVDDRLGSLQPGRLANLVVTAGDPLEVSGKPERVFIRGREVSLANRQTRLSDKYRQRYPANPVAAPSR